MSVRYNKDFKLEVVRAYMYGNKSTIELSTEYNVTKSTISEWVKKYGEEGQYNNLLNQYFTVDKKNKVWCTDFTYMRQPGGKFWYNCTIIDLYDRSAVASVNSNYINTDLAIETLVKALSQEGNSTGIILHSDQGVLFTSWEFVMFCRDHNVIQSMSKAGCPYDNAPMERDA